MNTRNVELSDPLEQVLALVEQLSPTEKMIIARQIESEMINLKLTELDWITAEMKKMTSASTHS
ncbi:MAG: hypothetical protein ABEI32_03095 [Halothece sp.]|jgi:hypothetical protein